MAEIRNDESAGLCYNPILTGIPREAGISRESRFIPHVTFHLGSSWMHIGSLSCALIAYLEALLSRLHIKLGL
ncbi:hypothetical protein N7453_012336 [Penicillium expansum]|nr:hypothetical protein N7453_012336 [Penicillium expansum]